MKELIPRILSFCIYSSPYTCIWYSKLRSILQNPLEISQQDVKSSIWHWIVSTRKALSTNISNQIV